MSVNDDQGIRAAQGKLVTINGRVQNVGQTRTGTIHFINFQGNTRGQFCGVIRAASQVAVATGLGASFFSGPSFALTMLVQLARQQGFGAQFLPSQSCPPNRDTLTSPWSQENKKPAH